MIHSTHPRTRVRVFRRLAALAGAACLTMTAGSASAGTDSTPPTTGAPASTGAAASTSGDDCTYVQGVEGTPVRGGTLTLGAPLAPLSLNPSQINASFVTFTSLAYESLTYRTADGTILPGLATEWRYLNDDNTEFELTLREGVTFTDGSELTAQGVVDSLTYTKSLGNSPYVANLRSFEATGPLTVKITTESPNPMLPELLSPKSAIGAIISPTALADPDNSMTPDKPSSGAGAYIYDPTESIAGDHYTYQVNPDYWDPCKQHFDSIVIKVFTDPQATLNALQSGQIDATVDAPSIYSQVEAAGFQIVSQPLTWKGLNLVDRNGELTEALGDVRVRQAINFALDRETIVAAVMGDTGTPTQMIAQEDSEGWSPASAERYTYDPERARELLAEAGYADGFDLDVMSIPFVDLDVIAEAMKANLAEVGINLNITVAPDEATYSDGVLQRKYSAWMAVFGQQPLFIEGPNLFLESAAFFNPFAIADPTLQEMYDRFALADEAEGAEIAVEINDYLSEQAWFAPVGFTSFSVYARPDLGGIQLSSRAPTPEVLEWYFVEQ